MAKIKREIDHDTAARIKARRKEQGITQERLAELLGRCEQTIRLYENGRLGVPPTMLEAMAVELDTTAEYLQNGVKMEALPPPPVKGRGEPPQTV